jgi:integrase
VTRGAGRKTRDSGTFGTVQHLPSGRYRALYYGPDGQRHKAPSTFVTKTDARGWLALRQSEIIRKAWAPPEEAPRTRTTFEDYSEQWLAHRDLKDRTREHYGRLLDQHLLPAFGHLPLSAIRPQDVRSWHSKFSAKTPTLRAHAYGLRRTIMGTAVSEGKLAANPCAIRGAGNAKRVIKIRPASLPELEAIANAMPPQYRAMILLASWCALRFGELAELRRKDIRLDDEGGVIRVTRAVVRTKDGFVVTSPKSDAGIRDVEIPPHLVPMLKDHLQNYTGIDGESLLFPAHHGQHLSPGTLQGRFYAARKAAGREDLRFHDLRHTGATLAATTGATLAELMGRLGHSTPAAAMRYQHAARGRDREIAEALSKLATRDT